MRLERETLIELEIETHILYNNSIGVFFSSVDARHMKVIGSISKKMHSAHCILFPIL